MTTSTKKNDIKAGVQSSEFYVAIAAIVAPWIATLLQRLEASDSAWVSGGVAAFYVIMRSVVKAWAK